MQLIQDLAIVLRSIPYEDRSRVVTALTEKHGLITAMARNSIQSRRFGGTLELFAASQWQWVEPVGSEGMKSLRDTVIKKAYEGIRKDFEALSLGSVFTEIMLKVAIQDHPCPDLFRLHSNALLALEDSLSGVCGRMALLNSYLIKILQWNGNQPCFHRCLKCHQQLEALEPTALLSACVTEAGWYCPSCESRLEARSQYRFQISPMAAVEALLGMAAPIRQVPSATRADVEDQKLLFHFIEALVAYYIPGFDRQALKGLKFLGLESNLPPPAMSLR